MYCVQMVIMVIKHISMSIHTVKPETPQTTPNTPLRTILHKKKTFRPVRISMRCDQLKCNTFLVFMCVCPCAATLKCQAPMCVRAVRCMRVSCACAIIFRAPIKHII